MEGRGRTDTKSHDEPPSDENTKDVHTLGLSRHGLTKRSDNDNYKYDSVHPLPADDIPKPSEEKMPEEYSD